MLDWKDASNEDLQLKGGMEYLLCKHPKLLDFIFNDSHPTLRAHPEKLLIQAEAFSTGERILIQVALDLWDGSGKTQFLDIIYKLDENTKHRVFLTLQYLNIISTVGAHCLSTIKIGPPSRSASVSQSQQDRNFKNQRPQ
jgi:hypothetical protein